MKLTEIADIARHLHPQYRWSAEADWGSDNIYIQACEKRTAANVLHVRLSVSSFDLVTCKNVYAYICVVIHVAAAQMDSDLAAFHEAGL